MQRRRDVDGHQSDGFPDRLVHVIGDTSFAGFLAPPHISGLQTFCSPDEPGFMIGPAVEDNGHVFQEHALACIDELAEPPCMTQQLFQFEVRLETGLRFDPGGDVFRINAEFFPGGQNQAVGQLLVLLLQPCPANGSPWRSHTRPSPVPLSSAG